MGGSVIPVAIGHQATKLSGSTPENFTIYNMDTKNAIWLANRDSVTPNSGMRLGPLGTLHWQKESGLAYACVDTGVASPVSVNVSNDVGDIVNPVDVATATAIALLAQGIPNVLVTTTLQEVTLGPGTNVATDVSGQASVRLTIFAPAGSGNIVIRVLQATPGGLNGVEYHLSAIDDGVNNVTASWDIPVNNFTTLTVYNLAGNHALNVELVGSNRIISSVRQHGYDVMPRQFAFAGNFTAGTVVNLQSGDQIADNTTRYNGPVEVHAQCVNAASQNAAGFFVNARYASVPSIGIGGVLVTIPLLPVVPANTMILWQHPSIPFTWQIYPNFTAAGVSVLLTVVPAGSGF